MHTHVIDQIIFVCKAPLTMRTFQGFIYSMCSLMLYELQLSFKPFPTMATCKWFLAWIVGEHVPFQTYPIIKSSITMGACIGMFDFMSAHVCLQVSLLGEGLVALLAGKLFVSKMSFTMIPQSSTRRISV
ncbi:hypothetical protein ONE63_007220 [Megalurothrips usitatus]|uniref:Uncharacterized protein n=1 Tax=Megalurothrips usitatus TaxID=439358 RepID=A0AAV7XUT1_9NEOP|nr:hypothetical protein ONE63_007220 [Megalurothrips usitatus]